MADDEFDPKKELPIEAMTKSAFNRWLTEQDAQVWNVCLFVKII